MKKNDSFSVFRVVLLSVAVIIIVSGISIYYFKDDTSTAKSTHVQTHQPISPVNKPPTKELSVVDGNNQFALDLYSQIKNDDDNVFFSPYSISNALAMTYEGARGKTADEIRSVFHFPADSDVRKTSFATLNTQLNNPDAGYKLNIANAFWAQNEYKFLDEYVSTLQHTYGAEATNVDFRKSTEKSRQEINKWVEERTNNKIKDLFPEGVLTTDTRLVLTNAIYFKGTWVKQFDKTNTREEDFTLSNGTPVKVPMMQRTDEKAMFNYAESDDVQVLEMPYEGNELSMLVLLPKNGELSKLENSLSLEKIKEIQSKLEEQRVSVFMPKFKFDTKTSMEKTLAEMGMPTVFTNNADLSGIDGTQDLFISKVIHQAFVDVNEEGTEAAAATGVVVGKTSISIGREVPVFRANHPFVFMIQDKDSGNILFMGKVANPKK